METGSVQVCTVDACKNLGLQPVMKRFCQMNLLIILFTVPLFLRLPWLPAGHVNFFFFFFFLLYSLVLFDLFIFFPLLNTVAFNPGFGMSSSDNQDLGVLKLSS